MPTPEDRSFFEGLNNDLAKSMNKAIQTGFKGSSIKLDPDTVKLIGTEMGKQLKPLTDDAKANDGDGGGGGGSGSAGQGGALKKLAKVAKSVFMAARNLVSQNATNMLAFGDTMARSTAATGNAFLMNGENLSKKFGRFGFNLRDVGGMLDGAMRANVRGLGRNTQNFIARTTGLGTSLGHTNKFLAAQTNVLGKSMTETTALGTDLQNIALSNGMVADAMFDAVAAFEQNTKKQSVIFGEATSQAFQTIVGSMEALMPKGNFGSVLAKAAPTDMEGLLNLDKIAMSTGGAFSSKGIQTDPVRNTAAFVAALAKFGDSLKGLDPRRAAIKTEQRLGKFNVNLDDIQKAMTARDKAGGTTAGLEKAMRGELGTKPIETDKVLSSKVTENSITAANNVKNFAIEVEGLKTVQAGIAKVSQILNDSFYKLNDATTTLAKTMGFAAAGEAAVQAANKLGVGSMLTLIGGGLLMLFKPVAALAKRAIGGIWRGLKGAFKWLGGKLKSVWDWTKNLFKTGPKPPPRVPPVKGLGPGPTPPGGGSGGPGGPKLLGPGPTPPGGGPGGATPRLPAPKIIVNPQLPKPLPAPQVNITPAAPKISPPRITVTPAVPGTPITVPPPKVTIIPAPKPVPPVKPALSNKVIEAFVSKPALPAGPQGPSPLPKPALPAAPKGPSPLPKLALPAGPQGPSPLPKGVSPMTRALVPTSPAIPVGPAGPAGTSMGSKAMKGLKVGGKVLSKVAAPLAVALEGFTEFSDTGDVSRSVSKAAGGGVGAWGGAAAGASLGLAFGPGAVVASPVLALLGGIAGFFGGSKAAEVIHDEVTDFDYVKNQEERAAAETAAKEQEAKEEKEKQEAIIGEGVSAQLEVDNKQLSVLEELAKNQDIANSLLAQLASVPKLGSTPGTAAINGDAASTQRG